MKIRIKAGLTGLYNGRVWPGVGETADVPDVVAVGLLDGGFAEAVKSSEVETPKPDVGKVETAVKRGPGRPPKPKPAPKSDTTKDDPKE